jgi:molecular chaperone GrpE
MSEPESNDAPAATTAETEEKSPTAAAPSKPPAAEPDGPSSADAASGADALEQAKAEAQKYREQLLRTAADFDNFRKRSRRDVDDAARKGKEQSLKDLLPVFDNLERALQSSDAAPDVKSVVDGLRMVLRQFTSTLERMNVRRVPAVGHPFDPTLHEAIQHVASTEHAAGVVTAEVQAGYQLGDMLLRAAMVVVSKGADEPEAPTDAAGEPTADA